MKPTELKLKQISTQQSRLGKLRTQEKVILNKEYLDRLEVAIGEIEVVNTEEKEEIHYLLSFGGDKNIRIIGKNNWTKFIDMITWLDWDPEVTHDYNINENPQALNHTLRYEEPFVDD